MPEELAGKEQLNQLLNDFDNYLFDCDGVIWHGEEVIPGVREVLGLLRQRQKHLIFVTNNATKSREAFKAKFDRLDIQADLEEIFGSAYASAAYLKYNLNFPEDRYVYVLGEEGIEHELEAVKIKYRGGTDPVDNVFIDTMDFSSITSDPSIGAVLAGLDMHLNYKKLAKAHRYLLEDPTCRLILTNDDSTFPTDNSFFPGSGACSAPLRYAFPDREVIVIGKPNQPMLDCILEKHQLDRSKTLMIGDRLDTDIAFGVNGGIKTLLVLTGVSQPKDYKGSNAKIVPHFVIPSLGNLAVLA